MNRRVLAAGIALVAVYLVALAVTVAVRDAHVRPLYDGFAPPPAYSWVDPPAFWAAGNVTPTSTSSMVKLGSDGSAAAGIATPDGQLAVDLGRGAIAPHGSDNQVKVDITPVDPKHLAAVPSGLRSNGNAYRVTMAYEPSNIAVSALSKPGSVLIEIPEIGNHLFTSRNGRSWAPLAARTVPPRELSLSAAFTAPAYYLAATSLPELVGSSGASSHRSIALGLEVAGLAVVVLIVGAVVVRRRYRRAPAP